MPQYPGLLAAGHFLVAALGLLGVLLALAGAAGLARPRPWTESLAGRGLILAAVLLAAGLFLIGWLHLRLYADIALTLPDDLAAWLNRMLARANQGRRYGLPLYDPADPPRYLIPPWIENGKYYFWFGSFVFLSMFCRRQAPARLKAALALASGAHLVLLALFFDPFSPFLPRFMAEIRPWFDPALDAAGRAELFMRLYPRQIFYYNASYMWLHPPLLFLSYAAVTVVFIASLFMFAGRNTEAERLACGQSRLGFLLLTIGMLHGIPLGARRLGAELVVGSEDRKLHHDVGGVRHPAAHPPLPEPAHDAPPDRRPRGALFRGHDLHLPGLLLLPRPAHLLTAS